jgi:hypothetical protein
MLVPRETFRNSFRYFNNSTAQELPEKSSVLRNWISMYHDIKDEQIVWLKRVQYIIKHRIFCKRLSMFSAFHYYSLIPEKVFTTQFIPLKHQSHHIPYGYQQQIHSLEIRITKVLPDSWYFINQLSCEIVQSLSIFLIGLSIYIAW